MIELVLDTKRIKKLRMRLPCPSLRKVLPLQKNSAITNQIPDQNSAMRRNYGKQSIKHEAHQKGSFSYHNTFNGYCSTCHKYGHRALECKSHEKEIQKKSIELMECLRQNFVGHATKLCHTIRCYQCHGFGHKAQACRKKRSQPKHENDATKKPRKLVRTQI